MRTRVALLLPLLAACGRAPGEAPAPPALSVWSRTAAAPLASAAGASAPPPPASADPAALDEILAAAPARSARVGTAPDGGTAIGAETGQPEEAIGVVDAGPPADPARPGRISIGAVAVAADMSDPALERAARAQIYWSLVQRCRDKEGHVLPPEAVRLTFRLDVDGYLLAPTILATAKDERFAHAARCMQRELSNSRFRAPASARGRAHNINADVPSVD